MSISRKDLLLLQSKHRFGGLILKCREEYKKDPHLFPDLPEELFDCLMEAIYANSQGELLGVHDILCRAIAALDIILWENK